MRRGGRSIYEGPPMYRLMCLVALSLAACNHDAHYTDGGLPPDARAVDGGVAIDAAPPAPGREVTSGAGHMASAHYVVDVQVGHGYAQSPISSNSYHVQGNAPVKP